MDTVTPVNPSAVVTDPTDDEYPAREATIQTQTCTACGLGFACMAVHPALSVVGLLPTPALCSAAFLALLRAEVTRRSGKEDTMTVTVCLPATEVISIDAMASVTPWSGTADSGTTTTQPTARSEGIEHLTAEHHATISIASD